MAINTDRLEKDVTDLLDEFQRLTSEATAANSAGANDDAVQSKLDAIATKIESVTGKSRNDVGTTDTNASGVSEPTSAKPVDSTAAAATVAQIDPITGEVVAPVPSSAGSVDPATGLPAASAE